MKNKILPTLISLGALLFMQTTIAASNTTSMKSIATISASCEFSSIPSVDFGYWNPTASKYAGLNLVVKCSNKLPYNLYGKPLQPSPSGGSGISMSGSIPNNNDKIWYNVYIGASGTGGSFSDGKTYTSNTGNQSTTSGITSTGTGASQTHPLQLRLYEAAASLKYVRPDFYSDNYLVTLSY